MGKIKVVPAEIGGGFGGKTTIYLEPLSVLLSKKTGHPVKLVMNRAEVLRASGPTSGSTIRCKMGATKDGKIVAAEVWMAYEAGGFPGLAGRRRRDVHPRALRHRQHPDRRLRRGRQPAQDRGLSRAGRDQRRRSPPRRIIDELAEKCGIDPLDFRIMNGAHEGTPQTVGPPYKRIGFIETVEAIKNSDALQVASSKGQNRGRGVAAGFWFNVGMQSSATVNIHNDGTASVVTGSVDIGGSRASMAMITAEVLGARRQRRAPARRRHRLDRPHRRDRRQPHHLRHRDGGLRGRAGRGAPAQGARGQAVGEEARRSRIQRRRASARRATASSR